jgi:hypothetical protein
VLKVDVPKSNTTVNRTPIFKCYVVRCRSKNKHHKDMCLKEIICQTYRLNNEHDWGFHVI